MKVSDLYPTKYLKGSDLAGHAVTVTIESILLESFFDQETKGIVNKPVLYFEGKQKGLVLSKGLAYSIASILESEDMDLWKGKKVVIFTEKRSVFGNIKDVFSARAAQQEPAPESVPQDVDLSLLLVKEKLADNEFAAKAILDLMRPKSTDPVKVLDFAKRYRGFRDQGKNTTHAAELANSGNSPD